MRVRDSVATPFLALSGRNLTIQGNQGIDISVLNHPMQTPFVSGGNLSLISDGIISGDAHFASGGNFSIQSVSGGLAHFKSEHDPIISSAGDVDVAADYEAVTSEGLGHGGDIDVTARSLSITDGSQLQALTQGMRDLSNSTGNSGNVNLNVTDSVTLSGISPEGFLSGVFTSTDAPNSGQGGNINVMTAGKLLVSNGGVLSAQTASTANGGDITVQANTVELRNGGQMLTSTSSSGQAGKIALNATGGVFITGSDPNYSSRPLPSPTQTQVRTRDNGETQTILARDIPSSGSLDSFLAIDSPTHPNPNVEFSTRIPYVSIHNDVSEPVNTYLFTAKAGTYATFVVTPRTTISVIDSKGNTLLSRDLSSDNISTNSLYFGFTESGTYSVQVNRIYNNLQVSLETPNVTGRVINPLPYSGLFARTQGTGVAGNITINTPQLNVQNLGQVSVETSGSGKAGDITLQPFGNGQNLIVNLDGSGQISGSTSGSGRGGSLQVSAPESVAISGNGTLAATAEGSGSGQAGNVILNTQQLTVSNGARVSAATNSSNSSATGGNLSVQASQLNLTGGSSLNAGTTAAASGGNLTIQPNGNYQSLSVNFQGGATASASTSGSGKGGTLEITAPDAITLNGDGSLVAAQTTGSGRGGDLTLHTRKLTVRDRAKVTVSSSDSGDAGNLNITANSVLLDNQGQLIAQSNSRNGGNINLQVRDLLLMRHNSLISASAGTANAGGDGGNITISAPFIIAVPIENSDIRANAFNGKGGNIQISTQGLFGIQFRPHDTPLSDITASSQFGVNGSVTINTPGIDPSHGLTSLPVDVVDASKRIVQNCGAGAASQRNSFAITGRGGLPPNPRDTLSRDAVYVDWVTLNSTAENRYTQVPKEQTNTTGVPLVEAQGWVMNNKGQVVLVAQAPILTPHSSWHKSSGCSVPRSTLKK